jgi:integrase/recombinase XerD
MIRFKCVTGAINPHAWRHTFAREYLQNGGDLGSLADIMGHADVVVTHRSYTITLNDELRAKHAKHSPLANMQQALAH